MKTIFTIYTSNMKLSQKITLTEKNATEVEKIKAEAIAEKAENPNDYIVITTTTFNNEQFEKINVNNPKAYQTKFMNLK